MVKVASLSSFYSQQENGSWVYTWFLAIAQTITSTWSLEPAHALGLSMVSCDCADYRHQYNSLGLHRTRITSPPQVATQATDLNRSPCGRTTHRHQHSFMVEHRPQTSTWPSVVTSAMGINISRCVLSKYLCIILKCHTAIQCYPIYFDPIHLLLSPAKDPHHPHSISFDLHVFFYY